MSSGSLLGVFVTASEQFWPHLNAILHWHRRAGPVDRLAILYPRAPFALAGTSSAAAVLERAARSACSGLKTERREVVPSVDGLRHALEHLGKEAPESAWILQIAGPGVFPDGGWEDLLVVPALRVALRQADGEWRLHSRISPGTEIVAEDLGTLHRDETDELSVLDLFRAQVSETAVAASFTAQSAKSLPVAGLVQAAIASSWDWKAAFTSCAPDLAGEPSSTLLSRFLGAFLLDLGLRNVVLGTRKARSNSGSPGSTTTTPSATEPALWIFHAGKLVLIEARIDATSLSADSEAGSQTTLSPLALSILRAADERKDLGALAPEWILIRPCQTLQPIEEALAEARGIRVFDEAACRELPARLAACFGVPLSPDGVEIERRLKTHIAETGRSRVFGPESRVLEQQRIASTDPAAVNADGLLEQIQRARGQNWLLWTHQERIYLRLPSEGRASASGDWQAMLAAFVGIDPASVRSRQTPRQVLLDFDGSSEHCRRVANLVRPFLNAPLNFDGVRSRFAAEARVTEESANAARAAGRPVQPPSVSGSASSSGTSMSSKIARPGTGTGTSTVAPRSSSPARPTAAPVSSGPRRMQRVSLDDLDKALDSALTSASATDEPPPRPKA